MVAIFNLHLKQQKKIDLEDYERRAEKDKTLFFDTSCLLG